ncbi:hypothetical protein [Acinetobacter indicus]|uniref:hypothetical protein n=1 Tax=Acinetobacter indicus TaxID=756892 RepID=UPI001444101C|nr:hypothetical protein [Acinetobacter indicus]
MNVQINNSVGARFKLLARKASTEEITRETEWFKNIVLDTGLNRMSVGTWIDRVRVGSGNSTPVASQTQLDNTIASTTTLFGGNGTISKQTTTSPYYVAVNRTYRFAEGVAAGNISEVGCGWGTGLALWNRALVKDLNGDPTTITVLSDEFLDVIVEVRYYPTQSFSGSFNLLNKTGGIVSSHTYAGLPQFSEYNAGFDMMLSRGVSLYSGSMNSINTDPSNLIGSVITTSSSYPNPITLKSASTFELTEAVGSIKTIRFDFNVISKGIGSAYKFEIDPPIVKTNQMVLSFTFSISWGRYEGA